MNNQSMDDQSMDDQSIVCSRCGREIGKLINITIPSPNTEYSDYQDDIFQIGPLIVKELHGNCAQCGQGFHYSITEKQLEKLIQKVITKKIY